MQILIVHSNIDLCDDIEHMLMQIKEELQVEKKHDYTSAQKWLVENDPPDILFIQDKIGSSVYTSFIQKTDLPSPVVLLSNTVDYALDAFEYNTLDYIVLPGTTERLKKTLQKFDRFYKKQSDVEYMKNLQSLMTFMVKKDRSYKKRFMVKIGNVIKSITVHDIAYFFTQEKLNYLVTFENKKFPIDYTLDELEEVLDPKAFRRANRQYVVNIHSILEIHPYFKGRVKINLKPQQEGDIVISSEKSRSFKEWLDE